MRLFDTAKEDGAGFAAQGYARSSGTIAINGSPNGKYKDGADFVLVYTYFFLFCCLVS